MKFVFNEGWIKYPRFKFCFGIFLPEVERRHRNNKRLYYFRPPRVGEGTVYISVGFLGSIYRLIYTPLSGWWHEVKHLEDFTMGSYKIALGASEKT